MHIFGSNGYIFKYHYYGGDINNLCLNIKVYTKEKFVCTLGLKNMSRMNITMLYFQKLCSIFLSIL